MEGESSGVQQAQDQGGQEQGVGTQQKQGQQAPQEDQVSEGDDTDYAAQLKAKDAEIEALISWLCAKRWCQRPGKGVRRPPPRIFSYHVETTGDNHVDAAAHDAHAMPPADMPTTDEGTIDFRRLAVRLAEQRVHAAMEMSVDELTGEGVSRNGYRERGLRTVIGEMGSVVPGSGRAATSPTGCSGPTPAPTARWQAR